MAVPEGGSIAPTVTIPGFAESAAGPLAEYGFDECSNCVWLTMNSSLSPPVPLPGWNNWTCRKTTGKAVQLIEPGSISSSGGAPVV